MNIPDLKLLILSISIFCLLYYKILQSFGKLIWIKAFWIPDKIYVTELIKRSSY